MTDTQSLSERFEAARPRLHRLAQRIMGSGAEAEDALQESWLRASRAVTGAVENVDGWLTTIVARACYDALKWRQTRREDLTAEDPRRDVAGAAPGERPEDEAVLADSVGVALQVLIDSLSPAERVAFVLHDLFEVPFDDIATIVERTPEAARQLASRARRRVRGVPTERDVATQRHDELVRAFFAASRAGDFSALLALLDPGATLRADKAVLAMGGAQYWQSGNLETGIQGAAAVANTFVGRARAAQPAYIGAEPVGVWMHEGELRVLFRFALAGDRIAGIEMIADPDTLGRANVTSGI